MHYNALVSEEVKSWSGKKDLLTRIPTPYRVYLIDTGKEGRARDSRPPQPHPQVDLFLTGGRDESR
jgi:hypothetical protein